MHFAEVTLSGAEEFGLKSVEGPRSSSLKSLRFRISNRKIVSLTLYCSAVHLNCVSSEVKFTLDTNICQIYKGKRVCVFVRELDLAVERKGSGMVREEAVHQCCTDPDVIMG